MKRIAYPAGIREVASKMGCELGTHARFGVELSGSLKLPSYLQVGTPAKSAPVTSTAPVTSPVTAPKTTATKAPFVPVILPVPAPAIKDRAPVVASTAKGIAPSEDVTKKVLVLGPNVHPTTALAVADRILSDPSQQRIVERTNQIAALPDAYKVDINPEAIAALERAAAAMDAAMKIRESGQTPPSQPIVPVQSADQAAAVETATTTYALTDADLEALAAATQQMIDDSRRHGPIERLLDWLKKVLT